VEAHEDDAASLTIRNKCRYTRQHPIFWNFIHTSWTEGFECEFADEGDEVRD